MKPRDSALGIYVTTQQSPPGHLAEECTESAFYGLVYRIWTKIIHHDRYYQSEIPFFLFSSFRSVVCQGYNISANRCGVMVQRRGNLARNDGTHPLLFAVSIGSRNATD